MTQPRRPHDLYNPTELYTELGPIPVTFSSKDPKFIRFTVIGKNAAATNFWVLLDSLSFD